MCLSVVLETSAPEPPEQLVHANPRVPPGDSDSFSEEWAQRICILTEPQVILRRPKFEHHCKTFSGPPHSPPIPVTVLIYPIIYSYVYILNLYRVPRSVLGARNAGENKRDKISGLLEFIS